MITKPEHDLSNVNKSRDDINRWRAEAENASARLQMAQMRERIYLVLSQHQPVASMELDRDKLRIVLDYIQYGRLPIDLAAISPTLKGSV